MQSSGGGANALTKPNRSTALRASTKFALYPLFPLRFKHPLRARPSPCATHHKCLRFGTTAAPTVFSIPLSARRSHPGATCTRASAPSPPRLPPPLLTPRSIAEACRLSSLAATTSEATDVSLAAVASHLDSSTPVEGEVGASMVCMCRVGIVMSVYIADLNGCI